MSTLNDDFSEIYQQFVAGNFATQLSSAGKFSRSETGQVIEMTLNRDTNTPGDSQQVQAKLCHHPPPPTTTHHQPKYIHHHPLPPTTSQNISPLPTITYHHPSAPTNSQNISTATYHFPKK